MEEDIQDANEFSIEQARKKMEWDKLIEAGEEKKRETRKQIAELRLRFKRLKELNERLPAHMRINSRVIDLPIQNVGQIKFYDYCYPSSNTKCWGIFEINFWNNGRNRLRFSTRKWRLKVEEKP